MRGHVAARNVRAVQGKSQGSRSTPPRGLGSRGALMPSGGVPLPDAERSFFEGRLAADFSRVRVHADAASDRAAASLGARAFTHGHHISFRSNEYRPELPAGRHLIAHELAHVVQQSRGATGGGTIQRTCGSAIAEAQCEASNEANAVGERFLFQVNCDDFLHGAEDLRMEELASDIGANEDLIVHGFASTDGPADFNQRLSCARATRIRDELIRHGVAAARITRVLAHGETDTAGETGLDRAGVVERGAAPVGCHDNRPALPRRRACVQPVRIADDDGSAPTAIPDLEVVRRIWGQCCIDITVRSPITIRGTAFKEIEDAGSGAAPTAEENDMFAAAGETDCVELFYVETIHRPGAPAGRLVAGGGTTKGINTADSKIIMVDGGVGWVAAHELGHSFGLFHPEGGVLSGSGSPDVAGSEDVTDSICTTARASVLTDGRGGGNDCCRDVSDPDV